MSLRVGDALEIIKAGGEALACEMRTGRKQELTRHHCRLRLQLRSDAEIHLGSRGRRTDHDVVLDHARRAQVRRVS